MKLQNGFGSICKQTDCKRRNPWRVYLPYSEADRRAGKKRKTLGSFRTKTEAINALVEYHKNPDIFLHKDTTFAEVFSLWSQHHFKGLSASSVRCYKTAFKHCRQIHERPINELRLADLQQIIDNASGEYRKKEYIKLCLGKVFGYAVLNDICPKSYVSGIEIGERKKVVEKTDFSAEEISLLWKHAKDSIYIKYILILIYTGMRKGELYALKTENIHLDEKYCVGGIKNRSSINRAIPIADKILPFFRELYNPKETLFVQNKITWNDLKIKEELKRLNMNHTPHECRHTFASLMQKAGVPLFTTQRIMGHKSDNITQDIYTHINIDELIEAVNRI